MYLIFYKTSDVFKAEEILMENDIKSDVVPTPVQDKAYCGICLKVPIQFKDAIDKYLNSMEYKIFD